MSAEWREAPLYVDVHAIAVYLTHKATDLPTGSGVPARLTTAALDLLDSVALGLTFPDHRLAHLRRADEAVVRLRMALRVAQDIGLLSPANVRFVSGRLVAAGRQLGGWRKRTVRRAAGRETGGGGPAPATSG